MRSISDEQGRNWIATAREEATPRHHGRWYMVFHPEGADAPSYPLPEARWQTYESAEHQIRSLSEFDLRRRLQSALARGGVNPTAPLA